MANSEWMLRGFVGLYRLMMWLIWGGSREVFRVTRVSKGASEWKIRIIYHKVVVLGILGDEENQTRTKAMFMFDLNDCNSISCQIIQPE